MELHNATFLYQFLFIIVGFIPLNIGFSRFSNRRNVAIVYSLSFFVLICYATFHRCYIVNSVFKVSTDMISYVLLFQHFVMLGFVHFVVHLESMCGYQALVDILGEFRGIERVFRQNNALWPCRDLNRFRRRLHLLSGSYVFVVVPLECFFSVLFYHKLYPLPLIVISTFCEIALHFKTLQFCVYVQIINELLTEINAGLRSLQQQLSECSNQVEMRVIVETLYDIKHVHLRIWNVVDMIQDAMSWSHVCLFFFYIFSLVTQGRWTYWAIQHVGDDFVVTCSLGYFIVLFFDLLIPCLLGQFCIDEYNRSKILIHGFQPPNNNSPLHHCVREYSLQLLHHDLVFSCGGFFNINLHTLGRMTIATISFVFIIIQFQKDTETA